MQSSKSYRPRPFPNCYSMAALCRRRAAEEEEKSSYWESGQVNL